MKHVVCFSGGKDSTALVLWAKESLPEFTAVFCDTKWESDLTPLYIEYIDQTVLGGKLITLTSTKYSNGMRDLVRITSPAASRLDSMRLAASGFLGRMTCFGTSKALTKINCPSFLAALA
jgi:hypothetical protein